MYLGLWKRATLRRRGRRASRTGPPRRKDCEISARVPVTSQDSGKIRSMLEGSSIWCHCAARMLSGQRSTPYSASVSRGDRINDVARRSGKWSGTDMPVMRRLCCSPANAPRTRQQTSPSSSFSIDTSRLSRLQEIAGQPGSTRTPSNLRPAEVLALEKVTNFRHPPLTRLRPNFCYRSQRSIVASGGPGNHAGKREVRSSNCWRPTSAFQRCSAFRARKHRPRSSFPAPGLGASASGRYALVSSR